MKFPCTIMPRSWALASMSCRLASRSDVPCLRSFAATVSMPTTSHVTPPAAIASRTWVSWSRASVVSTPIFFFSGASLCIRSSVNCFFKPKVASQISAMGPGECAISL